MDQEVYMVFIKLAFLLFKSEACIFLLQCFSTNVLNLICCEIQNLSNLFVCSKLAGFVCWLCSSESNQKRGFWELFLTFLIHSLVLHFLFKKIFLFGPLIYTITIQGGLVIFKYVYNFFHWLYYQHVCFLAIYSLYTCLKTSYTSTLTTKFLWKEVYLKINLLSRMTPLN